MGKVGRPMRRDETIQIAVRINASVIRAIRLLNLNPMSGEVKRGSINKLIERLLRTHLEELRIGNIDLEGEPKCQQ